MEDVYFFTFWEPDTSAGGRGSPDERVPDCVPQPSPNSDLDRFRFRLEEAPEDDVSEYIFAAFSVCFRTRVVTFWN